MSVIEITKEFTMPRKKLMGELESLAGELAEQHQVNCEWLSDSCLGFERNGAHGELNIGDEEIELTVKLGMLMAIFRERIQRELEDYIERNIY